MLKVPSAINELTWDSYVELILSMSGLFSTFFFGVPNSILFQRYDSVDTIFCTSCRL